MVTETSHRPLGSTFQALLRATATTNLGDGIRLAALPLLAETLTDSQQLIAGVTAAQFLPWLLFGPFGGVIVDQADRRRLILTTQAWRGLVMMALGAAVLTDVASIWLLCVVAFVITAGEILVDPSVVATVPTIVERNDLDRANGRISSVELVTNDMIGNPVGAGLFMIAPWAPFVADGFTYLSSVFPFRHLPKQEPQPSPDTPVGGLLAKLPEGLRFIRHHPMLRPWTASVAVFNVGAAAAFSLLVVLVRRVYDGSALTYGVTLTLAAAAGAVGSSVAARLAARYGRPTVMLTSAAFGALSLLTISTAQSLALTVAAWTVAAGFSGVLLAIGRGYVQRYCPSEILGRTAIASRTITRTAFVVGAVIGGVVGDRYGTRTSFGFAGAVQLVALAPMALALRHDRDDL